MVTDYVNPTGRLANLVAPIAGCIRDAVFGLLVRLG